MRQLPRFRYLRGMLCDHFRAASWPCLRQGRQAGGLHRTLWLYSRTSVSNFLLAESQEYRLVREPYGDLRLLQQAYPWRTLQVHACGLRRLRLVREL